MEEKLGSANKDEWNWEALGGGLELSGRLVILLDGRRIVLHGEHERLKIDLPDLTTGRRLLRALPSNNGRSQGATGLRRLLSATGLQVDIRISGRTVAVLAGNSQPGLVARLLGLGPARIRPLSLLLSALGRRRVRRSDGSGNPP